MERYEPLKIEAKWREKWEKDKSFRSVDCDGGAVGNSEEAFLRYDVVRRKKRRLRDYVALDILMRFDGKECSGMSCSSKNFLARRMGFLCDWKGMDDISSEYDVISVMDEGYGADTIRVYEMFVAPLESDVAWDSRCVGAVYRFLNRCYNLCFGASKSCRTSSEGYMQLLRGRSDEPREDGREERPEEDGSEDSLIIRYITIKKVTEDIKRRKFNTAVAALMKYVNVLYRKGATEDDLMVLAKLLKPFAPYLASEMLGRFGADDEWPKWDEKYLIND